jgi:hypothetical protein
MKNSAERVNRIHPQRSYLLSFCGLFLDTYTPWHPTVLSGPLKILLACVLP